jgi:glucose/mannose transport system substrate-binding protein
VGIAPRGATRQDRLYRGRPENGRRPSEDPVRLRLPVAAALALLVALAGCSSTDAGAGSDPNNDKQVEAVTWWTTGVEKTAFYAMVSEFSQQNPDLQFLDASVRGAGGDKARAAIAARVEAKNPPDTFLTSAGAGLSEYVAKGQLQDLTAFYTKNGLRDVYRAALIELMSVDGKIYSVPSDIHRVNVLWADNALLKAAGVDPAVAPADLDAWIADLQRVRDSGVEYPLALGNELTQLQLFENVLIADLGAVLYQNLWTSTANWDADSLTRAVDHYQQLLAFTDPQSGSDEWSQVADEVIEGRSAYTVMADYTLPAFQRVGFVQYSVIPTPGTVGVFDFLADSFTLPVGAVHDSAARAWLLSVSSAEAQKALSLVKGSIPARTDTVAEDYPAYQQTAIASLQLDTVVPSLAHGVAASPDWTDEITDALVKFRGDQHPQALVKALIAAAKGALG